MELRVYIVRRILLFFLVLFGIIVIMFTISRIIPADPIVALVGYEVPPDLVAKIKHDFGLDKPLVDQFWDYLFGVVRGDFGRSFRTNEPVARDVFRFLPATLELAVLAIFISLLLAIPTAVVSALKRDTAIDHAVRVFSLGGISIPSFWSGLIVLYIFYLRLGLVSSVGRISPYITPPQAITGFMTLDSLIVGNYQVFWDALSHLILPAFVLGYLSSGWIGRITRASLLEVMRQDYVRMARAKGLTERVILLRHILRNALIPTTTIAGLSFGALLEGSFLVETIFAYPGLGAYAGNSVLHLDYMAIMAVALVAGGIFSVVNLIADITYAVLDPRIRYG